MQKSLLQLLRRKSGSLLMGEHTESPNQLKRVLGPFQLTMLGIGAIIGAGIFSAPGNAAAGGPDHLGAGPALTISLLMVAIACGFSALCYAEFASMVPVSGSAYTYAYATLGELVAWLVGWDLILEYAISNAAVAVSCAGYLQSFLHGLHVDVPPWLGTDFRSAFQAAGQLATAQAAHVNPAILDPQLLHDALAWQTAPHWFGFALIFNLPAFVIVALVTWIVLIGIRETAHFNSWLVAAKLAIVVFFVVLGAFYIHPENWTPFAPNGFKGVSAAAAILFFAYIGFDAVSTAAEETKNPKRDLPIGILASLAICTVLYIAVGIVLTGMVRWDRLGTAEPLADAFTALNMPRVALIVALGGVFATLSALVPYQAGQPRIFFSMGRDGLLPPWTARLHPRYRTPHLTTLLTGLIVALCSSVSNINELLELTNIGTLFAFVIVAGGILFLRWREPDLPRPFKVPLVPWIPLAAMVTCGYLMLQLPAITWWRFVIWMMVGLALYFLYGFRHSRLAGKQTPPDSL